MQERPDPPKAAVAGTARAQQRLATRIGYGTDVANAKADRCLADGFAMVAAGSGLGLLARGSDA